MFAHLEMMRPYTAFYVGLVGLAGASASGSTDAGGYLLSWLIPTSAWIAGLYGGDFIDRELDAQSKPHRPIPSGRVSARTALAIMISIIVVAASLSVWRNPWTLAVVGVATLLGVSYNKVFKRRGLSGHLVRGSLTAAVFAYGVMVANAPFSWWIAAGACAFWLQDAASNLVGAVRDIDGDRAGGYQTVPVRYGIAVSSKVAGGLSVGSLLIAGIALWHRAGVDVAVLIIPFALWILALRRIPTSAGADRFRADALAAHEILVLERLFLAAAFVIGGMGWIVGTALLAVSVSVSRFAQRTMRARYEFGADPMTVDRGRR
ncbi:UbiA family prenyltransferase [Nocardia sp. NPDC005825]|uniref:UbiA family prenyltransferase n=1 Tax=Nocardia sp. NPDC005825 TaxID=3155452 RepID=UPI0033C4B48C